jgi:hypothetical protein
MLPTQPSCLARNDRISFAGIAAAMACVALSTSCVFIPYSDATRPEFEPGLHLGYEDQERFLKSLSPPDQVSFVLYERHRVHPSNVGLSETLASEGDAVFADVVDHLKRTDATDWDRADLSAVLCRMKAKGLLSASNQEVVQREVTAALGRTTSPYARMSIEHCIKELAAAP